MQRRRISRRGFSSKVSGRGIKAQGHRSGVGVSGDTGRQEPESEVRWSGVDGSGRGGQQPKLETAQGGKREKERRAPVSESA
jgi:hypothetical protein